MANMQLSDFIAQNAPAGGSSGGTGAPAKVPLSQFIQTQQNAPAPAAAPAPTTGKTLGNVFQKSSPGAAMGTPNAYTPKEAGGFLKGAMKSIASIFSSADSLGATRRMAGQNPSWTGVDTAKALAPTNPSEAAGETSTDIASLAVPLDDALKAGTAAKDVATTVGKGAARLFDTRSLDEVVGQITQGNKAQIAKATDALKMVDTTAVKTYSDLKTAADNTIKDFAKAQDAHLSQFKKPYPISTFDKATQVYDKAAGAMKTSTTNLVQTSIDHLKELYTNLHDTDALASISKLEQKANEKGLTAQEINGLARKYGYEMASKAFTKMGDLSTSVTQRAFENVRSGLKDISRSMLPTKLSQTLDESMGKLYTLRDTAQQMEDGVQKLSNRLVKRNIIQKGANIVGKGINAITGGALKELFSSAFLKSGVGKSVMDSVTLQDTLEKNLARVNKLADSGTDQELLDFVKENAPKVPDTPKPTKTLKSLFNAKDNATQSTAMVQPEVDPENAISTPESINDEQ